LAKTNLRSSFAISVAIAFFGVLGVLAAAGHLPILYYYGYLAASVIAFMLYRADKSAAEAGRWRISESTLHLASLMGGWPGALIAQYHFRHKTRKRPFRFTYWVTVVMNCGALAWFMVPQAKPIAAEVLRQFAG